MNVEFLEAAEIELDQAVEWYETQQGNLGLQFLNELDAAIRRIVAYPDAYVSIGYGLRRCLVNRFPYAILYGIDSNKIVIVAVAHLHRKPHYWLNRITS